MEHVTSQWMAEYAPKVRAFMEQHGRPVEWLEDRFGRHVSTYGWNDFGASKHAMECGGWIVPRGSECKEETFSQFTDTNHSNAMEVGVNVDGCHCRCGELKDVTLRWNGPMSDMLIKVLELKRPQDGWVL